MEQDNQTDETNNNVRLVKMRGKYPRGGPKIVREEFEKLGFTYAPPDTPNEQCFAIWSMRFKAIEFQGLKSYQSVNFLPAIPEMAIKSKLHQHLYYYQESYPQEYSFWPLGYNLPVDWEYFEQDISNNPRPFILKPARCAMGMGIRCATSIDQVDLQSEFIQNKEPVAQEYIINPQLLDGFKTSFRIYVAVTSYNPLRIYIFPNGLTRISSEKYTEDIDSFVENYQYIHLTNVDINHHNEESFLSQISEDIKNDGLRVDAKYMFDKWRNDGLNVDKIWNEMKEIAVKTFIATEEKMYKYVKSTVKYRSNGYELLGYDFLVDVDEKVWLLEINSSPNLEPHTELETVVKRNMIRDLLQLVDVERNDVKNRNNRISQLKQQLESGELSELLQFLGQETLTSTEMYTIAATELEMARKGEWQVCFPLADSAKYEYLFSETTLEHNMMLTKYVEYINQKQQNN
eukprot:TRINITY_DN11798_c0_g1_i1.p1 TRINITY_DN11798_c0_g1~~TRINITY_DN11798_c0_g1_i1.p1  ORF type:complete len:459 (-),score=93.69 TRINITY_DN11798_c0_g1_i1:156-1532(-)